MPPPLDEPSGKKRMLPSRSASDGAAVNGECDPGRKGVPPLPADRVTALPEIEREPDLPVARDGLTAREPQSAGGLSRGGLKADGSMVGREERRDHEHDEGDQGHDDQQLDEGESPGPDIYSGSS